MKRAGVAAVLLAALATPSAHAWRPDVPAAVRYAEARSGDVRLAVWTPKRRWGHEERLTASSVSLAKAMLLVADLRRHFGRAVPRSEQELLRPMIRASGNRAATIVRDRLGSGALDRLARRAGMRDFAEAYPIWGASRTSPEDQARFFLRLPELIPRRHRAYALDLLATIIPRQRWGIGEVAPKGWKLYFKGGWGSGTGLADHQSALLVRGRRRIAISVMTVASPSHRYAKRTLAGVFRRLVRGL
jgi:hypothetical protein